MKLSFLALCLSATVAPFSVSSFSMVQPIPSFSSLESRKSLSSVVLREAASENGEESSSEAAVDDSPRVEPDTHDELMYALGVNLARQLGDVRPLVENGEELAEVAKGLLDTVVGTYCSILFFVRDNQHFMICILHFCFTHIVCLPDICCTVRTIDRRWTNSIVGQKRKGIE